MSSGGEMFIFSSHVNISWTCSNGFWSTNNLFQLIPHLGYSSATNWSSADVPQNKNTHLVFGKPNISPSWRGEKAPADQRMSEDSATPLKLDPSGKHPPSDLTFNWGRKEGDGRVKVFWYCLELRSAVPRQPLHVQRANPRGSAGVHGGYVVFLALMGDYTC